jgi:hypothetical protein
VPSSKPTSILENGHDADAMPAYQLSHPYILWFGISAGLWMLIGVSAWLVFKMI